MGVELFFLDRTRCTSPGLCTDWMFVYGLVWRVWLSIPLIIRLFPHLDYHESVMLPKTRLKGLILIIKSTYQPWYVTLIVSVLLPLMFLKCKNKKMTDDVQKVWSCRHEMKGKKGSLDWIQIRHCWNICLNHGLHRDECEPRVFRLGADRVVVGVDGPGPEPMFTIKFFFWVLIDFIVELLVLIIKPFDDQTERWNPLSNDLIIKSFDTIIR